MQNDVDTAIFEMVVGLIYNFVTKKTHRVKYVCQ